MKRKVVTLCGSTRFFREFQRANYEETMAGHIVLSVGFYGHSSEEAHGEQWGCTPEEKEKLDELHLDKIDMSDDIFVVNVGGYIGDSTKREISFAVFKHKEIRWLEPELGEKFLEDNSHELGQMVARFLEESR